MDSTSELVDVFCTCIKAVVTFTLLCVPGFVSGYIGFFTQEFISTLAKLNLNVLVPCLILSNVGSRLQLQQLSYLWPLLVWAAVQLLLGLSVATALLRVVQACMSSRGMPEPGLSKTLVRVLPCVAAVQNSVGFPLPVMQTVCKGLGPELGSSCYDDAVLYMFVYNVVWQVFLWTVVYALLQTVALEPDDRGSSLKLPLNGDSPLAPSRSSSAELAAAVGVAEGVLVKNARGLWGACRAKAELIVNPPLCALAAAIAVAACPRVQLALFRSAASPFSTLGDALSRLGSVTPVTGAILLSASLGRAVRASRRASQATANGHSPCAGAGGAGVLPRWATAVVLLTRLVLVPLLGLGAMRCLDKLPGGSPAPLNRTMHVLVALELASPSATNCIVLCQRLGLGDLAEGLATMYVPMYIVGLVTVPVWLSVGLYLH